MSPLLTCGDTAVSALWRLAATSPVPPRPPPRILPFLPAGLDLRMLTSHLLEGRQEWNIDLDVVSLTERHLTGPAANNGRSFRSQSWEKVKAATLIAVQLAKYRSH